MIVRPLWERWSWIGWPNSIWLLARKHSATWRIFSYRGVCDCNSQRGPSS